MPAQLRPVVLFVPTRDEAPNIAHVADLIRRALAQGVIDRAIVLDGQSNDDTTAVALAEGLEVFPAAPEVADPIQGKGDAVWRAATAFDAGTYVLIDADVVGIDVEQIRALVDAIADGAVLAKGSFTRLQSSDGRVRPIGGRITEFLVKPVLGIARGDLHHVTEPLSGQLAIRGDALRSLPLATGYGLEISMLLGVAQRHGSAAIVDVPLGSITHAEKTDARLVSMAHDVAATLADRLPLVTGAQPASVTKPRPLTANVTVRPAVEAASAAPPAWLPADQMSVMGIVNVNADSFSDSRDDFDVSERITFSRALVDDGAHLLDLGTQSARTDLPPEDEALESERLEEILGQLADVPTSIDTYKLAVARTAIAHGAAIINDYSGLSQPDLAGVVADAGVWYI
ncbi:MAG: glucosyl-3-phosphoglycerate synthase, partial [Glaciecola sp.]